MIRSKGKWFIVVCVAAVTLLLHPRVGPVGEQAPRMMVPESHLAITTIASVLLIPSAIVARCAWVVSRRPESRWTRPSWDAPLVLIPTMPMDFGALVPTIHFAACAAAFGAGTQVVVDACLGFDTPGLALDVLPMALSILLGIELCLLFWPANFVHHSQRKPPRL